MDRRVRSDKADLSRDGPGDELHVDDVVHQAFVRVNESGTEAAVRVCATVRGEEPLRIA
jgi:serine protease inhibitor